MLQRQRSQFFDRLRSCPGTPSLLPIDVLDSEDEKLDSPQFPVGCLPQSVMGRGKSWTDEEVAAVATLQEAGWKAGKIATHKGWAASSVRKLCAKLRSGVDPKRKAGSGATRWRKREHINDEKKDRVKDMARKGNG